HVERFIPPEAEAATRRVELQRRHTEIRQHPVDLSDTPCVQHVFETAIVRVDNVNCAAGVAQCFAHVCERLLIAIEPYDLRRARVDERTRMSRQPHSAINEHPTPRWLKML